MSGNQLAQWVQTHKQAAAGGAAAAGVAVFALYKKRKGAASSPAPGTPGSTGAAAAQGTAGLNGTPDTYATDLQNAVQDQINSAVGPQNAQIARLWRAIINMRKELAKKQNKPTPPKKKQNKPTPPKKKQNKPTPPKKYGGRRPSHPRITRNPGAPAPVHAPPGYSDPLATAPRVPARATTPAPKRRPTPSHAAYAGPRRSTAATKYRMPAQ